MKLDESTRTGQKSEDSECREANRNVLLSAFGIHTGGGLVLLQSLLTSLESNVKLAILDGRVKGKAEEWVTLSERRIKWVVRSSVARLWSLAWLARRSDSTDILLCFNSLPPLWMPKAYVITFVHAPHFVNGDVGIQYGVWTRLRIFIEKLWFRLFIGNSDEVWVQTKTMSDAVREIYSIERVRVVPLVDSELAERLNSSPVQRPDLTYDWNTWSFFYPADGIGHKNHVNLLKAWGVLERAGFFPTLILTLESSELASIMGRIPELANEVTGIRNIGRISRQKVLENMQASSALLFPSKAETFGIPLLEARAFGVPIIASERTFVRDVCDPIQTFDPQSPASIASAVRRFIVGSVETATKFYSADEFVSLILQCPALSRR